MTTYTHKGETLEGTFLVSLELKDDKYKYVCVNREGFALLESQYSMTQQFGFNNASIVIDIFRCDKCFDTTCGRCRYNEDIYQDIHTKQEDYYNPFKIETREDGVIFLTVELRDSYYGIPQFHLTKIE